MKIIRLRFRNLNSLAGEWSIDFSSPEYVTDGIFAISGPTGAGKSTILDAICLALYGRTPRLPVISNSTNEIMSRQTGDCFAEVVFETTEGSFKAHWSQRRARGKPGGALQQPRHEISLMNGAEGKLLASQITQTKDVIEEKSGMTFERFTQSMMLAQGGFAAFLKAKGNERAPILEQITGTEIYSDISIHVFQHNKEQSQILENMRSESKGIMLMSGEEEAKLKEELDEENKRKASLDENVKRIETEILWLKKIKDLSQAVEDINKRKAGAEKMNLEFGPSGERLERAIKASYVEGEYASLATLADQQKKDLEALHRLKEKQPEILAEKVKAEKDRSDAEKKYAEAREARDSLLRTLTEVRLTDQQISRQDEEVRKIAATIVTLEKERKNAETAKAAAVKAVSMLTGELDGIEEYQKQNSKDASLPGALAGIDSLFERLEESRRLLSEAEAKLTSADELMKSKSGEIEKALEKFSLTKKKHREEIEKAEAIKKEISELLKGETVEEIVKRKDHLFLQIAGLKQIADYDNARTQLEDGKPCPLCGSVHHPYAAGNIPRITREENELHKLLDVVTKHDVLTKTAAMISADERRSFDDEANERSALDILKNQREEIEKKIAELASGRKNAGEGIEKISAGLKADLLSYGITEIPSGEDETDSLRKTLKAKKDKWEDNERRKITINGQILTKQPEIAVADNVIKTREKEIAEKKKENTELLNLLKDLKLKREELFGSRIPDDEERSAEERIAATGSSVNESADILKQKEQLVTEITTRIKGYEEGIVKREESIASVRGNFMVLLGKNGFETEEEFLGSRMPAEERAALEERSRELEKEKTELEASAKAKAGELEREKAKELTAESEGNLTAKLEESKTETGVLYESIVRKGGKLKANEEAKDRGREIAARINDQMIVCERWSKLSGLIGSADGKKYRNFAQSLTLEVMVSYANSQLSRLSDRYLLVRNREEPLDLDVIDNYQAGEIRSTKNLSGGESFIVSLALALGLSHMAGRKVRIDSLFLDEGFGTLDEETLETALSTLASLRQDGKIIGVISHVGAMKERIGTKITVTPVREGRSILSGPGCSEVSSGIQE